MDVIVRILRYLKSALGKGLLYSKNNHLNIKGYTDAHWARSVFNRKSTSSYFFFVGGNLVTWKSGVIQCQGRVQGNGQRNL